MTSEQDFRILGPIKVITDRQVVPIRAPKLRVLLGALLVHPNKSVGIDDLADRLWEDSPQRKAKATLHTYVWRLRLVLGDNDAKRVVTTADGYRIDVEPHELDLIRFRALADQARRTDDLFARADLLERALAQWQGRPLEDAASDVLLTVDVPSLEGERLDALERRFDVELRIGRHENVLRELQVITAEHPLRERFHGQLMLALHRSGRQADVFTAYQSLKDALADQLGVDPNHEVRLLHHRILTDDPAIRTPQPPPKPAPPNAARIPRELPMDVVDFVGREQAKEQITALLTTGSRSGVPVVVISGQPGVGKTALAVTVAHRLRDQFPDGQLYADLRGHSTIAPLHPDQVLSRFLISLGVPPQQVPSGLDELTTLYRTLMADRRVLLLLDNVATPQQVRPVLPSTPGCGVLVTSRNQLRGLTALQGARPLDLDVLPAADSHALLGTIIGTPPTPAEADGWAELARLCGHLPLALRIVAANVVGLPGRSLRDHLADLREGNRLAALEIEGDDEATVRAAFALSYAALDPRVAHLFRLLGLVPGPDFTVAAVAALAAVPTADAADLLDRLTAANLVARKSEDRYQLHDLLRLYAAERCHQDEDATVITTAKERLYHFYLRHVDASGDLLFPTWLRMPRAASAVDLPPVAFADAAEAASWMDQDCLNVFAAIIEASDDGFRELAWPMAEALRPYLVTAGKYRAEGLAACEAALRAAVDDGAVQAEAALHHTIGAMHYRHADPVRAMDHFTGELRAHRASGSTSGQARTLITIGNVHHVIGDVDQAATHVTKGLALAEAEGDRQLLRFGLLNLSAVEVYRGNLAHAEELGRRNLSLASDEERESVTEGTVRGVLGQALHHQGRGDEALAEITKSVELFRRGSASHYEANGLGHLALAHLDRGDPALALEHARAAVKLADDSGAVFARADTRTMSAKVHHDVGDHERAKGLSEQALDLARKIGMRRTEISALIGLAEASRMSGDHRAAAERAEQARHLAEACGFRVLLVQAGIVLAKTSLDLGDHGEAAAHALSAADLADKAGMRPDRARALRVLGLARAAR